MAGSIAIQSKTHHPGVREQKEEPILGKILAAQGCRFNKGWFFREKREPKLFLGLIPYGHTDVILDVYEPINHGSDPNSTLYRWQNPSPLED
jgi:hypothetical protein